MTATPTPPAVVYAPIRSFYLRRDKDAELEGPYTYYEADTKGRTATREAARTRVGDISMELVTIVGERPGDPPGSTLRVVALYLAGRKVTGGALAAYNSARGNT